MLINKCIKIVVIYVLVLTFALSKQTDTMKTLNVKTLSISQKLGIGFTSGFVIVDNSNNPIKDEMGVLVFRTKSAAIAFITPVVISGMSYRKVRNPHSSNYPVSLQLV